MTYCMSDIHGQYDLFMRLMEKIKYSNDDRLIVCGDLIDKGAAPVRLAKTVFKLPNSYCIMGNHEYMFLKFYRAKMDGGDGDFDGVLRQLRGYFPEDGNLLDWDTVDILVELPFYIEEKNFVCVHAGAPMDAFNRILPLDKAMPEALVHDRIFKEPNVLPKESKCVFFGHTPTTYLQSEPKILTYPKQGAKRESRNIADYCKIHLDTGTPMSGVLGCFCVEDCHAVYVSK